MTTRQPNRRVSGAKGIKARTVEVISSSSKPKGGVFESNGAAAQACRSPTRSVSIPSR